MKEPNSNRLLYIPMLAKLAAKILNSSNPATRLTPAKAKWAKYKKQNRFTKIKYKNNLEPKKKKKQQNEWHSEV